MTNYGKELLTGRWTGHELEMMQRAWEAGVNVPYPVGPRGDGMLMQFLGDDRGAAPRLVQARLGRVELEAAFGQLVDNLRLLVGAGYVHADLSAYNLLWWQGQVWLIDFPPSGRRHHQPARLRVPAPRRAQRVHVVRPSRHRRQYRRDLLRAGRHGLRLLSRIPGRAGRE
jgi:serine/threonine-protein kinase RIO1